MLFILYIRSYTFYLEVTDLCWPGHLSKRYRIVICLIFFLLFHSIVFRMLCPVIVRWRQATLAFNMTGLCHVPNLRPFFLSIFWLWLWDRIGMECACSRCACAWDAPRVSSPRGVQPLLFGLVVVQTCIFVAESSAKNRCMSV